MKPFLLFVCQKCGTPYYCKASQKSKTCFNCQHRIQIKDAKILAFASSLVEARNLLEAYKIPSSDRTELLELIAETRTEKPVKNKDIFEDFVYERVLTRDQAIIDEDLFFSLLIEKGLLQNWISRELNTWIQRGLVIRPKKGILKFIT